MPSGSVYYVNFRSEVSLYTQMRPYIVPSPTPLHALLGCVYYFHYRSEVSLYDRVRCCAVP